MSVVADIAPTVVDRPPRPRGRWAAAYNVAIFALTCGVVSALLYRVVPEPPLPDSELAQKLAHFAAHRDEYDTLFFGSSFVYRGIVPEVFDAQTAAGGQPTHSFNMGVAGMQEHEVNHLLAQVLALHPRKLRYVFIEAGRWDARIAAPNRFTPRTIWYHTAGETHSIVKSIARRRTNWTTSAREAADHVQHLLAHYARAGQGSRWFQHVMAPDPASEDPQVLAARRELVRSAGYVGLNRTEGSGWSRHRLEGRVGADGGRYGAAVRTLARDNQQPATDELLAQYNVPALERQVEAIRTQGITPVYFVPAHLTSMPELARMQAEGLVPTLYAFNDPTAYPALYEIENRHDWRHPSHEGALLISRLLAERFLASPPGP